MAERLRPGLPHGRGLVGGQVGGHGRTSVAHVGGGWRYGGVTVRAWVTKPAAGPRRRHRALHCPMDDRPGWATVRLRLAAGEDAPALDTQLAAALRDAADRGIEVAGVSGVIAGPLNDARRGQVARLFERLRAGELSVALGFVRTAPADLGFLGRQARAHRFSVALTPTYIAVVTPWAGVPPG